MQEGRTPHAHAPLTSARRDALILGTLVSAAFLLVGNGSAFFREISAADQHLGGGLQLTGVALTLNVALLLFGWRRYVDLQHETERRLEGERRAALAASTDALTGLLNRKGFADKCDALRLESSRRGEQVVIISLQLHRFRSISDRHGHGVGDELMRRIAASLLQHSGEGALVARLGGDELAVAKVAEHDELQDAERLAGELLALATRPFEIEGRMVQVGGFAGIAAAPAGEVRIPDLLRRADIAVDHAKSGRIGRPAWFDAAMERALIAHAEIEQGIRFGIEHEQFIPYFEPQVDLTTCEIVGFEVLARWKHPLSGIVAPDVFLPVAQDIGLMDRLSEQVIRSALVQAADWDPSIKVSVNVSPSQFADGWLAERIVQILTETGFPAERLVVEVTESSLFADLDLARGIVTSLKNQGIRLALDDFGTGFSSLAHLRALPFDIIKIDRSFVTNIHQSRESAAIVQAVVTLASALDVPVLVEGIENEAAHATVLGMGCAVGQGWYFGKPMDGGQAAMMLDQPTQPQVRPEARSATG